MAGSENVKPVVKVGDKVRCLVTQFDVREGELYEVKEVHDGSRVWFLDDVADRFFLDADEYELWPVADATGKEAFKVGDRVRLIKDGLSTTGAVGKLATIKSWSGGKVIDNGQYLLDIDGPVDYETRAVTPQYTRASPECFELLAPSLTIETGKFYRTRDGRKVGPMVLYEKCGYAVAWLDPGVAVSFVCEDSNDPTLVHGWRKDGRYFENDISNLDLIAEWVDEPSSNDNQPVAEQQDGAVYIDVTNAGPSQLHVAKGPLVRLNKGYYGYELARYGEYVWVEIGQKAPIVMRADAVTVAA
ncbi:hypothetical protein [Brucella intermedia]|uniref:hypothetical protein n=1 Tax=Brucella intermedia TaxID=94625 RepID=UPI001590F183|nr:hypothetical protein [Brucella intermedia]